MRLPRVNIAAYCRRRLQPDPATGITTAATATRAAGKASKTKERPSKTHLVKAIVKNKILDATGTTAMNPNHRRFKCLKTQKTALVEKPNRYATPPRTAASTKIKDLPTRSPVLRQDLTTKERRRLPRKMGLARTEIRGPQSRRRPVSRPDSLPRRKAYQPWQLSDR